MVNKMEKQYQDYTPDELARMRASGMAGENQYRRLRAREELFQELGSGLWQRAEYLIAKAIGRPNTKEGYEENLKIWDLGNGQIVDQEANKEAMAINREITAAFAGL